MVNIVDYQMDEEKGIGKGSGAKGAPQILSGFTLFASRLVSTRPSYDSLRHNESTLRMLRRRHRPSRDGRCSSLTKITVSQTIEN